MQLGRAILEVFEAIPERIEVSGVEPTWKVTGGSFDAAVAFAEEAFAGAVVVERNDRDRWWHRVTLTVTTDPELAATAPPLEQLAADPDPEPEAEPERDPEPEWEPLAEPEPVQDRSASVLEEIFAYQEGRRLARRQVPQQRGPGLGRHV